MGGYESAARFVLRGVMEQGIQTSISALDIDKAQEAGLERLIGPDRFARLIEAARKQPASGSVCVTLHPPGWYVNADKPAWADFFGHLKMIRPAAHAHVGFTMFETDRIDRGWVHSCNGMDEVWVPSEFNRQTFVSSGVDPAKIQVIPLGLEVERYNPAEVRPLDLPNRAGFNFLSVFEWNKRKGYDVLLRAYAEAFTSSDDVALYVRTYGYSAAGRSVAPEAELRAYFEQLCPDPSRAPRVVFLMERIPDEQMPALYAACDAFVLPTRGEGWGIPYMEAMAMAKPTIGTRWSAHTTFMNDDNAFLIDVKELTEVAHGDAEYPSLYWGHRMAEPDAEHLKTLMRQVAGNPAVSRARGDAARRDVLEKWTSQNTGQRIRDRLAALQSLPRPQPTRVTTGPATRVTPKAPAHVVWQSPLLDGTGYADEARNFVLGLDKIGVDVRAEPIRWSGWELPLPADETTRLRRQIETPAAAAYVRVEHISPLHFRPDPRALATVGRTMFETDGLSPDWVARCNSLDEIWVPTQFNLETFARAGVDPRKLRKVPEALDGQLFRRDLPPLNLGLGPQFTFLSVFDWIPRKGWDVLLRAYVEEFSSRDNVRLLLKVYTADGSAGEQDLLERLKTYVRDVLGRDLSQVAPITLLVGSYTAEQMAQLYRLADAYVMPTRGEGWGRPMMEAMASGLPTIATGWGGNTEFMTADNSYLVEYQLEPIPDDVVASGPWFAGQRWAEPSATHLRQVMRHVLDHPEDARATGTRARAEILERYDRPTVARIVAGELERIVGRRLTKTPVTWEGSQFVYHSLAHINRELCLQLTQRDDVDLSIRPYEPHQFDASVDPRFARLESRMHADAQRPAAVHVRHQWPPSFTPPSSGAWVMIQPWEFGGIPADWVAPMRDQVDEVWVPSTWVRECYIRSGVPGDRVRVIPNGLDLKTYQPEGRRFRLRTRKTFKFLFVGGTIGRKGIDILLETYARTFTANDDVCLVIKAAGADGAYRGSTIEAALQQIRANPDAPEIEYLTDNLSDQQVASLYRSCDVLVHPYRGEGFGMPIAEAMACGLAPIVTGYGAALDFCDADTAYLIPAREVGLSAEGIGLAAASPGYWWAEPDRAELARLMRHVVSHPAERRAVGLRARARMLAHDWSRIGDMVGERLAELGQRIPRRLRPTPLSLVGRRATAFLHHPEWRSDSWQDVLRSYCDAFSGADDVTLVLLLDPAQGVTQDEIVTRVTAAIDGRTDTPDLLLVPEAVEDVTSAYDAVDCLVPSGDACELERARRHGVRVLSDLAPATWRAAA